MELELVGSTVSARTYYGNGDGAVVAVRNGGNVSWLLSDEQRSEQLSVNATTSAVSRQRYLPFGARRGGRDDITRPSAGSSAKAEDDTTGLVHLDARFYDPVIGKFISPDPLVDLRMPEWANPYAYAGNNPESRMDPTGLASCSNPTQCDHMEAQQKEKKKPKKKKPKVKPKPTGYRCERPEPVRSPGKAAQGRQAPGPDQEVRWDRPRVPGQGRRPLSQEGLLQQGVLRALRAK